MVGSAEISMVALVVLFFVIGCARIRSKGSPMTNWPVVGMLPGLIHNAHHIHGYATRLQRQSRFLTFEYKGPWFANMDMIITSDPVNVDYILSKNHANFERGAEFKRIFDPFGDGIFNSDDQWWKLQRRFTHSLLKHGGFQKFLVRTTRHKVVEGLLPVLDHFSKLGEEIDLQEILQRFSFDNNSLLVLGFDPGCLSVELPEVSYAKAFDAMEEVVLYRHLKPERYWRLQRWLRVGDERKLREAWETFETFLAEQISSKRELLRSRNARAGGEVAQNEGIDLLTACMEERDDDDDTIRVLRKSDKFVRDAAFNLIGAGRGTIAAAMTWFVWLVSTHPSAEQKIREEIILKLGPQVGESEFRVFTEEEVNKLTYLHATLSESLRLYPPIPLQHKTPVKPDTLPSGHRVEPGRKLLLSSYSVGRMEEIWGKDCEEFRPDRWVVETGGGIKQMPSYKFLVFNAGPRSCIGKEMSLVQLKIIATAIVWNYRIEVVKGHPVVPRISVVLHMKHGLKVKVSRRRALIDH